jgi:succinoglycan biosynthesis protein ExoV
MKIIYFKGEHPNFGDDLNPWMWPQILPGFFDEDERTVFLGIGSIIGERKFPTLTRKIIFGSGFVPEYHDKPDVRGADWNIYFVRGPRTARMLDISPDLAIGDSAILLRTLIKPQSTPGTVISFMPHWQSLDRGNWEEVCRLAGINLIDPRMPLDRVLEELQRSRMVVTEAMHGAIVADALRIPWVPLIPINTAHRGKWLDWADALNISLNQYRLWPSSLEESRLSILRKPITSSPFAGLLEKGLIHAAAHRLTRLAQMTPSLSADREIERATERMVEKVELLRRHYSMAKAV